VPGLENVDAIFDTGTTMILGDPAGITDFFAPLVLLCEAEPLPDTSGYTSGHYSSMWTNNTGRSAVVAIFDFCLTVPCNFNTSISIYVGEKEIKISPKTFNLGPISDGSDRCLAGAASDKSLTGSKSGL